MCKIFLNKQFLTSIGFLSNNPIEVKNLEKAYSISRKPHYEEKDMDKKQKLLSKIEELKKEVEQLGIEDKELEDFVIKNGYHINSSVEIEESAGNSVTFNNLVHYNIFETEEEAEEQAKIINEYLKLYHIAKYLNDGWEPDWSDNQVLKYSIFYDNASKSYGIDYGICCTKGTFNIYFKSKELAEKAIKYMGWE